MPGRPLESSTSDFLGSRLGHEFSHVHATARTADFATSGQLLVRPPGGRDEQEADRIADRALRKTPPERPSAADPTNKPQAADSLSAVRVHTDARAAESARVVGAQAYTVGQHVVFAAGEYAPQTERGKSLLAHELAHVAQQARSPGQPAVQRRIGTIGGFFRNIGRAIADLFGDEPDYDDDTLLAYLRFLVVNDEIEDDFDSDNKARAVVARWKRGDRRFELTVRQKKLLIEELLSGFTGDDDERAILELLKGSTDAETAIILSTVGEAELRSNFHGGESDELEQFLQAWHAKQERMSQPTRERAAGSRPATIVRIVVQQEGTQTVTIFWSDGRVETDICSTGKGLCCVDSGGPPGPGWSEAESRDDGSNRTPAGKFKVALKLPRTDAGVELWTEFDDPRDIALHEYSPVDGTPLSHGCVRLNRPMAQKIFDGSVVGRTVVEVRGTPRPRCDHPMLQREWAGDFREAGTKPPDGETPEARRRRKHIAVTRRTVRRATGLGEEALTEKIRGLEAATGGLPTSIGSSGVRARTLEAIAPVAAEIPRCRPRSE